MTDCFALFDLPRQPSLNVDLLKERFTKLSAQFHPDKIAGASEEDRARATAHFAELNSAYQTLRETRTRLGHLIQLESGHAPGAIEKVSNESADLFFEISGLCRKVDQFLSDKGKSGTTSPMLKAARFAQSLDWTERVQSLQQVIQEQQQAVENEVHRLNGVWDSSCQSSPLSKTEALERLKGIYSKLGYLTRWNAQLQERLVQLAI
jgi:DnaJ-domain-containing protein 1